MRRLVMWLPGLLGEPEGVSWLRETGGLPAGILEHASIARTHAEAPFAAQEFAPLGLDPTLYPIAQGPLTVSALGFDPPERSVHFQLSLLSLDHQTMQAKPFADRLSTEERTALTEIAERLKTKTLTPLMGPEDDHALVWEEGSLDLQTTPPSDLANSSIQQAMPQGEGESLLRRFIDDSANLLLEAEFNRRREDEERPQIGLFWPWGQGLRPRIPSLAIRRGEPAYIISDSARMRGLARLTGDRPLSTKAFSRVLEINFHQLHKELASIPLGIFSTHRFQTIREAKRDEEGVWLTEKFLREFCDNPCFWEKGQFAQLILLLTRTDGDGLAVTTHPQSSLSPRSWFDERLFEEKAVPRYNAWEWVKEIIG